MEAENYAVGHCVLGAHSIGAAHIRQRLYWVADYYGERLEGRERTECTDKLTLGENRLAGGLADAATGGRGEERPVGGGGGAENGPQERSARFDAGSNVGRLDDAAGPRHFGAVGWAESNPRNEARMRVSGQGREAERPDPPDSLWRDADWLYCRDGKYRPIESGIKPLVDGVPRGMVHSSDPRNTQEARAMRLKGYGNAIVPQVAAEFIRAFMALHAC